MWLPAGKIGAFSTLSSWVRSGLCGALLALLAGCGLLPGCGCEEPPKPPPAAPAAEPGPPPLLPPAQQPQAAQPPSLPIAPLPPAVSQAPLTPPATSPPATSPQATLPPVAVAPSPRPPAPPATTAGRYGAQLGAFRSLANASSAWERYKARYIDLLNTVPGPLLREVDLGPKGKFVRVMAGPFNTEQEARSLCIEVLARGGFCYVQPLGR